MRHTDPKKVLDGADMNQDVCQLIGYCVSLGWTEKEMQSTHCTDLAAEFLRKHRNETQWRDISSAPKDGTEILLTDGKVVSSGQYTTIKDELGGEWDWWFSVDGGFNVEGEEPQDDEPRYPTHWMPLPAPPKEDT